jgi:DNA polymerase III epsilon subunit-like protein
MAIVFFDFETGGVDDSSPNIQLAAVAVDDEWKELGHFERKIQFDEAAASKEALEINHYDPEIWKKEAVPEATVVAGFDAFLARYKTVRMISKRTGRPYSVARLGGHNIISFDIPRLRRMFGVKFLPVDMRGLDTLQLAMWFFYGKADQPEDFKLSTLAKYFGFPHDAHDALGDVRACATFAKTIKGAMVLDGEI